MFCKKSFKKLCFKETLFKKAIFIWEKETFTMFLRLHVGQRKTGCEHQSGSIKWRFGANS